MRRGLRLALTGCLTGLGLAAQAMAAAPLPPVDDPSWTGRYDEYFRKYAKRYFGPGYDWRWFKSQAIAESTLNPRARSPAGAVGLMQILPSTFREIRHQNPSFKSLNEPRWNIAAGIFYDRQLYKRWGERFGHFDDKLDYTFGSYNAGFGGMSRAYRKAGNPSAPLPWPEIAPHAPRETRAYVARINGLMTEVQAELEREAQARAERERMAADTKRVAAEEEAKQEKQRGLSGRLAGWFRGNREADSGAGGSAPTPDSKATGAAATREGEASPEKAPELGADSSTTTATSPD